jgi:hypothetical protein
MPNVISVHGGYFEQRKKAADDAAFFIVHAGKTTLWGELTELH